MYYTPLELSTVSDSRTGRLLEGFLNYIQLLPKNSSIGRIAHGGSTMLILYTNLFKLEELEVCVDLFCERMVNRTIDSKIIEAFKRFIYRSYEMGERDPESLDYLNNIKL